MNTEPAFPVVGQWYGDRLGGQLTHGMTLRDYFAAKAMQPLIEKYSHDGDVSRNAYKIADAMLQARDQ
jgi:hypothetical protein